MELPTLLDNP